MKPSLPALTQREVADYVGVMASELSQMSEGAHLDALATILYAAHLEARRAIGRLDERHKNGNGAQPEV